MRSSSSDLAQQAAKLSVIPGGRYPTKDVAGDRHMADGRELNLSFILFATALPPRLYQRWWTKSDKIRDIPLFASLIVKSKARYFVRGRGTPIVTHEIASIVILGG